jgi:hypothetical protein
MKAAILVLAFAAATSIASASNIALCDTGVSNCATETPDPTLGALDSNFTVTMAPGGSANGYIAAVFFMAGYYHGTNPYGTGSADWITTESGTTGANDTAVGLYEYQDAFSVTKAGTYTFTGDWGADNCGAIEVNGMAVAGTNTTLGGGAVSTCKAVAANFDAPHAFAFTLNLSSGTNYLDFNVWNSGGPTALIVDNLQAVKSPEPSPVLLTLTGCLLLGVFMQRRWAGNKVRQ